MTIYKIEWTGEDGMKRRCPHKHATDMEAHWCRDAGANVYKVI